MNENARKEAGCGEVSCAERKCGGRVGALLRLPAQMSFVQTLAGSKFGPTAADPTIPKENCVQKKKDK